jgi:hypothetical protein
MVIENPFPEFSEWLGKAGLSWLAACGILFAVGLVLSIIVATAGYGPRVAIRSVAASLGMAVSDLLSISPRRIWALSVLAVREAIRRKVVVAFGLFVVVLLFAAWFLDPASHEPAKLYLAFVLNSTSFLILILAWLISAFSLPLDIAQHTIYTVVTKPVRHLEIVLGRVLGFTAVGTGMLAVMGFISYVFVNRALVHSHEVDSKTVAESVIPSDRGDKLVLQGNTHVVNDHRHKITIDKATGEGRTDTVRGHWHPVRVREEGGQSKYEVGPPQGMLTARVPIFAHTLEFLDRDGKPAKEGISVGDEWTYRTYIEGASQAAAIWKFRGLSEEQFPEDDPQFAGGIPFELTLRVFRTHKGDIEKGIAGSMVLKNPKTGLRSTAMNFVAKEFDIYQHLVPRTLPAYSPDNPNDTIDVKLFRDLVADGELIIELSCLESGQYFGMAKPDLYILASEGSYIWNFAKGHVSIWLQMVMLISFGVMFSTFLNGFVALLATGGAMLSGFFLGFIQEIATGTIIGGGPFESMLRMLTRAPMTTPLEPGITATTVQGLDYVVQYLMWVVMQLLPDMGALSDVRWVASGYDIPANDLAIQTMTVLGFFIPLALLGHLILRSREVAK